MNINFYKARRIYLIIAAAVIALAFAVFFIFGFASDSITKGYTEYKAVVSSEADLENVDIEYLKGKVKETIGNSANVAFCTDSVSYETVLVMNLPYGSEIDEQSVVTMLNAEYPDFAVDSLSSTNYGPSAEGAFYLSFVASVIIVLAVLFVISLFFASTRNACLILLGEVLSALMVTAVYLFARVASFMLLIASVFASIVFSFVLGIVMLKALDAAIAKFKKPKHSDIMNSALNSELGRIFTILVLGALFAIAFTVIGLVFGYVGIIYIGVMLFGVALASLFTTTLIIPTLWKNK